MSALVAGNYFIVNVDVVSSGALALSYNGENSVVTVSEFDQSVIDDNQVWTVSDYDATTQSVSPYNDGTLQIGMGDGVIETIPAGSYVWTISGGPGVYTVEDGGQTVFWDLAEAVDGADVYFDAAPNCPTQYWQFIPAPV